MNEPCEHLDPVSLRAHLAAIVDSSDDAILSKDLDGTIRSWNRAAQKLYGYTAEEVVGRSISMLVPADRPGEVEGILERIRRDEVVDHFETERVAKDGTRVLVSLTISPIRNAAGNVTGASTIARDITERVRSHALLDEQAQLLDIAQDAILARDLDGRITYWNRTCDEMYGWNKHEALGQVSHQLLHTRFPVPLPDIEAQFLASDRWEGELVHTSRSGAQIVVASRWIVPRDGQGQPLQVLEVNNDITDRKAAQGALAERETMLTTILETSPDVIAVVTPELQTTYVNPAAQRILGYGLDVLLGRDSLDLVHPDDIAAALELLQSAFGEAGVGSGRLRARSAAGHWVNLDLRVRRMASGEAAVVMVRDVSEQVALEENLHDAREQAEQANRAKSEFLSRMSHELRTPLNAVLGFAQLLEMGDLTQDQRDSTQQIIKGGRRLLDVIDEVLDISRIESGTLRLSLEPVLLRDVVEDAVDLIRPLADSLGIRLRTDLPDEMREVHVVADQQRFGQVLLNLLSNAVKYNVREGTVLVAAHRADANRIRIGVTDTGPGIPEDKIPLLFTPFERLGAEQTSVEGTGLGLALSKSLIEAMGGIVEVDTMKGQGTTFWVQLQCAEEPVPEIDVAGDDRPQPSGGTGGKVLYIEDNLSNLRLIERLIKHGIDVELIPAMTGTLGLDLAQQHIPDLVLLDLHLPDLRGEEVLIRLRKDPRTRAIPVVILSADATPGQIERLRASGADDYLTKPIDVVAFLDVVNRILQAGRGSS